MSTTYSRLTYQNRIGIYYLLKQGLSLRTIAKELAVSPSAGRMLVIKQEKSITPVPLSARHSAVGVLTT